MRIACRDFNLKACPCSDYNGGNGVAGDPDEGRRGFQPTLEQYNTLRRVATPERIHASGACAPAFLHLSRGLRSEICRAIPEFLEKNRNLSLSASGGGFSFRIVSEDLGFSQNGAEGR